MEAYIKSNVQNGIAHIEFYHPMSNALPSKLLADLSSAILEAGQNNEVKAVLLKSAGERAFCAGASFDELISITNLKGGKAFFSGFAGVINACRSIDKFVIGRIQGKAVGGGVGLACATDLCFASSHASVKLSELAIGIGPFVIGPVVEKKIGNTAFKEMAIQADKWYDANWAKNVGIYTEVFDNTSELDTQIKQTLQTLSTYNPEAMKELKRVFWEGTEHWDKLLYQRAETSGKLVLSPFTKNAIEKFKSK